MEITLDLFSTKYPDYLDESNTNGLSLIDLLSLSENQETFLETYAVDWPDYYEASIIDKNGYKAIYSNYLHDYTSWEEFNDYTQLYNLTNDLMEVNDLFQQEANYGNIIRERTIQKAIDIRNLIFGDTANSNGDPTSAELEKLRALGYIK